MRNSQLENFTTLPLVVETEASSDICLQMFCVFNKLNSYTDISFFFFQIYWLSTNFFEGPGQWSTEISSSEERAPG